MAVPSAKARDYRKTAARGLNRPLPAADRLRLAAAGGLRNAALRT